MKKASTLFSLLILGCSAVAAPISRQQALQAARNFLGTSDVSISLSKAATLQSEDPELYVFNRDGGGYVILSGDDAVEPVLGWSDEGAMNLDDLNPSASWWLGVYRRQIREVRTSGTVAAQSISRKWKSLCSEGTKATESRTAGTPVVEYTTATWDQESPYNNVCSSKVHKGVYTGCVATAAAIVCRHFQWPESGTGTIPSYMTETDNYSVPSVKLGHSYDYSKMPLTNANDKGVSWTSAQKTAVATLMFEIGAMSNMDYTTDASGAYTANLVIGLTKYMHYNKQAVEEFRTGYSDTGWLELIKTQLKENGPLIYGGSTSSNEAHQFVLDGYDSKDYFHVNWGWGGDEDGWFLLSSLGKSYKFNEEQSVITNLVPDKEGTSEYRDYLLLSPYESYKGLSTEATSFKKGTYFNCKIGDMYNAGSDNFNGKIYVAVYDRYGKWKENISSPISVSGWQNLYLYYTQTGSENYYYWPAVSCRITGEIRGGDRLRVHYVGKYNEDYATLDSENGSWEIVIAEAKTYTAAQIAKGTSLSYDRTKKKIVVKSSCEAKGELSNGTTSSEFYLTPDTATEIDVSTFSKGTWTIVLNGGADDLSIPVKL